MTTFWDGPLARTAFGDVDWASLTHAYGVADDVPGQLDAVRSADEAERDRAYWALYGNVFHQGTRYAATPHAARALIPVAADPATPERHRVLALLAALAIGYDDAYLPHGFDVSLLRREAAEVAERDPDEARGAMEAWVLDAPTEEIRRNRAYHLEVFDFGFDRDCVRWALESYDAVREGAAVYRELLGDDAPEVRIAAAYLLAWFPEDAARSTGPLMDLARRDADPVVRATAAVAVRLLGGHPGLVPWAEGELVGGTGEVAWAAAFVLAAAGGGAGRDEVVAALLARVDAGPFGADDAGGVGGCRGFGDADHADLTAADGAPADGRAVPFLGGDLGGMAMAALELLGEDGVDVPPTE